MQYSIYSTASDEMSDVADHLVQSIIRFAGASYGWYVNIYSGTVGDR
jgi:hypothetical protein